MGIPDKPNPQNVFKADDINVLLEFESNNRPDGLLWLGHGLSIAAMLEYASKYEDNPHPDKVEYGYATFEYENPDAEYGDDGDWVLAVNVRPTNPDSFPITYYDL